MTERQVNQLIVRQTERWIVYPWIDGWIDGWMNYKKDEWIGGWVDGYR